MLPSKPAVEWATRRKNRPPDCGEIKSTQRRQSSSAATMWLVRGQPAPHGWEHAPRFGVRGWPQRTMERESPLAMNDDEEGTKRRRTKPTQPQSTKAELSSAEKRLGVGPRRKLPANARGGRKSEGERRYNIASSTS